jgi:hypothetical protein
MIVVVPDAHALPFETMPVTHPGDFWPNLYDFWAKNRRRPTKSFSMILFLLSKPAITLAMSLRSEQLRVYRWEGCRRLIPASSTLVISLG